MNEFWVTDAEFLFSVILGYNHDSFIAFILKIKKIYGEINVHIYDVKKALVP